MIVALATVMEFLEYLRYICVNIHSPWQQYYYTAESLAVLGLWVWLGGIQLMRSNSTLWGGATDL